MISIEREFEKAQAVGADLIRAMGHQQALLYVLTYPTKNLEERLVATTVKVAVIQQMRRELVN